MMYGMEHVTGGGDNPHSSSSFGMAYERDLMRMTSSTEQTLASCSPAVSSSFSHSTNPISYNPISNLAIQYNNMGRNATVYVQIPAASHVEGGVETLIKGNSSGSSGGGGIGRWKQVAKSQLEKGMTNLTLRAGGNVNTTMSVGAYRRCPVTAEWKCYGMTEWMPLDLNGNHFSIPLVLPVVTGGPYQLQLYYKVDGKQVQQVLLQKKAHLVGTADLPLHAVSNQRMTLPMTSHHVLNGLIRVTVLPDLKFPRDGQLGWSLTDPAFSVLSNYNPTLSQSFILKQHQVMTERSTESTLVLPLATAVTRLFANAIQISKQHFADSTSHLSPPTNAVQARQRGHAHVRLNLHSDYNKNLKVFWQKPNDIFEQLIAPSSTRNPNAQQRFFEFYPKLHTDPTTLLPGTNQHHTHHKHPYYIGTLRIQYSQKEQQLQQFDTKLVTVFYEAKIHLEQFILDHNVNGEETSQTYTIPFVAMDNPQKTGPKLYFKCTVDTLLHMTPGDISLAESHTKTPCTGGLLHLTRTPWNFDTLHPQMETLETSSNPSENIDRRNRQLQTMGNFINHVYAEQFLTFICNADELDFKERYEAYYNALVRAPTASEEPSDKRKDPRPFRPSSSRMDALLTGLGFNVHVQSLSVQQITPTSQDTVSLAPFGQACVNVTCGAPADHVRGFSSSSSKSNNTTQLNGSLHDGREVNLKLPSGGLRRLVSSKAALEAKLNTSIQSLITSVAQRFAKTSSRHICTDGNGTGQLLKSCREQAQYLHRLTWNIAVRKANVFSQACTIAVTAYLAHVTTCTEEKAQLYAKHGFLLVFKGLLSTAGKELGMIEDASVGIAMLRNLHIVLCPDTPTMIQHLENQARDNSVLPVPESPYLRWLHLSVEQSSSKFKLHVGIDVSFYQRRVPHCLQNNVSVQLFPILYQMGVDIRQWGANAVKSASTGSRNTTYNRPASSEDTAMTGNVSYPNNGNMIDEEDDDEDDNTFSDNDVLVQLNMEAFWKMNAYVHNSKTGQNNFPFERSGNDTPPKIHPMLVDLYELIRFSSGKMEHGVLDEAASLAVQLGGAGAIFCKSGKDRTAMQVTYQQAQHVCTGNDVDKVVDVATMMRIYGTRLPICEKNVGQALFAFNSLQSKFMPDVLKPPPRTLAGFLKGGRVFSREGAIET